MSRRQRACRGLTLLEALILITIVGVAGTGVGVGLHAVAKVPTAVDERLAIHNRLVEKMEELASMDFDTLNSGVSRSDTFLIGNRTYNRTVTIALADADGSGGAESDYLAITVTVNNQSLSTRLTKP